jgi:hypothetical protein
VPNSKKLGLNQTTLKQKHAKLSPICTTKYKKGTSKELIVKDKTIRVLVDSGLSGDLLFMKKGSSKNIPIIKRAVSQLWSTSNGTFITDKVGNIEIAFVDFSCSKRVHLAPDIVEHKAGLGKPMYDLIIGNNTMHE